MFFLKGPKFWLGINSSLKLKLKLFFRLSDSLRLSVDITLAGAYLLGRQLFFSEILQVVVTLILADAVPK
jgi:hypothetical protein